MSGYRNQSQYGSIPGYGGMAGSKRAGIQRTANGILFPCSNCLVAVPQDFFYAQEKFGQYEKILEPGLAFVGWDCCGVCISYRSISKRVEQNDCIVETKTKDNVFVVVKVAVQQQVSPNQAESAIYKLSDVNAQVDSYVADVVRSHMPKMLLDDAFEKKDTISDAIQEQLSQQMSNYGFKIHKALVTEVRPDQQVMDSMNEINKQKRLREAAIMAAEADKIRTVKAAEGSADAACLQGEGIARQRSAIVRGLRDSINEGAQSTTQLAPDKISELLLISQYFETLKEIGANCKSQSIFIPQSPASGIADIANQIKTGVLSSAVAKQGGGAKT